MEFSQEQSAVAENDKLGAASGFAQAWPPSAWPRKPVAMAPKQTEASSNYRGCQALALQGHADTGLVPLHPPSVEEAWHTRNGVQSRVNEAIMPFDIEQAACPLCGELIAAEAVDCPHCGSYLGEGGRMESDAGAETTLSWLVPIGRSGWAIAAGYLALCSIFPFLGLPFSLGAVITGILAIRTSQANRIGASVVWRHHGRFDLVPAASHAWPDYPWLRALSTPWNDNSLQDPEVFA
jgi:hypothetical protein